MGLGLRKQSVSTLLSYALGIQTFSSCLDYLISLTGSGIGIDSFFFFKLLSKKKNATVAV